MSSVAVDVQDVVAEEHMPKAPAGFALGRFMQLAVVLALGFCGGLLVAGRTGSQPVNVAVHLNGAPVARVLGDSAAPVVALAEDNAEVVSRELKKTKSTNSPTKKPTESPTNEPTVQATFPHGTASPVDDRKRRALKKTATFNPGFETYNPTPVQFHPTKKPSSERRELKKKSKKTSSPTHKPTFASGSETYNPTPVQFHPTKKPSSERRELKKSKKTSSPTHKPTESPTVQATFPHGTSSPVNERRVLKTRTPEDYAAEAVARQRRALHEEKVDERELKKSKTTKSPTHKPTESPTVQATFPHGTASPVDDRRRARSLKTAAFNAGFETYNPTPVQFHPTKKPSSDRRQLKKSKSTKSPTHKPTTEPTVQATFPHGTASPSSEKRRTLKKETNYSD